MPIYEYQCRNCQHHFEQIQKFSDAPIKQCPNCLQDAVERLISAAAFQLKGTGWYQTDFKNKDKKEIKKETTSEQGSTGKEAATSTTEKKEDKKPSSTTKEAPVKGEQ